MQFPREQAAWRGHPAERPTTQENGAGMTDAAFKSPAGRNVVRIFRRQIGLAGLVMCVLGLAAEPVAGVLAGREPGDIAAVFGASALCVAINAFAQMKRGRAILRSSVITLSYYGVMIGLIYLNRGLAATHLFPLLWSFSFVGVTGLYGSWMLVSFTSVMVAATLLGGKLWAPNFVYGMGADQSWLHVASLGGWWISALVLSGYCGRKLLSLIQQSMQSHDALQHAMEREAAANALASGAAELRRAHRVAHIGTWRQNLVNGTIAASDELLALMALDISSPAAMRASFLDIVPPNEHQALFGALTQALASRGPVEHEWRARRPDGVLAWFWGELSVERDETGRPLALRGVCQDVTEHRTQAERVYRLAHHDPLTGLANRALLAKRVDEALAGAQRAQRPFAVLCLDLDGFKGVNDLHGHSTGDRLLKDVAARMLNNVREGDTVARLGGDEFVVLQLSPDQPDGAQVLASRLVGALAEPYELGPGEPHVMITVSVGAAIYPGDGQTADDLLRNADIALYRAKTTGKNISAFFRPEMDRDLRDRRALEQDLRGALARGEFRLVWQPLSEATGAREITGFEVLLRWDHPQRGAIPPDHFIPIAEACGAINPIGAWVLMQACTEAARWPKKLRVAVNASPIQLHQGPEFTAIVRRALKDSGLEADRLVLEVTEGVLIREPERVLTALRELKAMGVQVALDDFGTGYSSLATLRAFPFDKLKIDRSFISGLEARQETQDAAIVRAVLGLARGLGLPVTAEGVETAVQLGVLRSVGCDEVQGWLIGRPAPIEAFADMTGVASAENLESAA